MSDRPSSSLVNEVAQRVIYSIGHGNGDLESFLDLLGSHAIDVVVDVRSQPSSRFTPHFSGEQLRRALDLTRLRYLFLGRELGGRPADTSIYDEEGYVRYDRLAASPAFRAGVERLLDGLQRYRVAILCSEEDPISCHRRRLIGRALASEDVVMRHLRQRAETESESDVAIREALEFPERFQLTWDEPVPWRSIHPVADRVPARIRS